MTKKTFVNPPNLYKTPWQFNQAIKVTAPGSLLFLSGIVGIATDGTIPNDIVKQAELAYASLKRVVEAAGGTLENVVKTNVYVGVAYGPRKAELRDVRAKSFSGEHVPATTLLQVAGYANPEYLFEIEAIAVLD